MELFFSGIALFISVCTSLRTVISRIPRIGFDLLDYRTDARSCKVYVRLSNLSSLPLIVYDVSISADNITQPCFQIPKAVYRDHEFKIYTAQFPINLAPHQSGNYFLEYRYFPENKPISLVQNKKVVFQVHSNRIQTTKDVILGEPDHYLHIRL